MYSSIPGYNKTHTGTVLVLANGFTLNEDYAVASKLRPDHEIITVNQACRHYNGDHIFSFHKERKRLGNWVKANRHNFPAEPLPVVHSIYKKPERDSLDQFPWVDYFWAGVVNGGSSGWMAVYLAQALGYDEIILCGMPMEKGNYSDGDIAKNFRKMKIINYYRDFIRSDTGMHPFVKSMSGWTCELLGSPC